MPLQYSRIVDEHHVVRQAVGVFDVGHMGKVAVQGRGAASFLDELSAAAIPGSPGQAQYTHLLREDGTTLDDVIVACEAADRYLLVCNASARATVVPWLSDRTPPGVSVVDRTHEFGCIAVQGPKAPELLDRVVVGGAPQLAPFRAATVPVALGQGPSETEGWGSMGQERPSADTSGHRRLLVTRTGYTGEAGFELFPAAAATLPLWERLLGTGGDLGVRPIGLGARDILRLEKGYLLAGQDFDGRQTPLELGCGWLVAWDREFLGRAALLAQRARGDFRRLVGLRIVDRAIPRHGQAVLARGAPVGVVTSGTHSPSLRAGIALASVDPPWRHAGTELEVDVRGESHPARVVRLPFV
jgi:aminomethyltransferase